MNLVERLREKRVGVYEIFDLQNEAADRIEELESVLRQARRALEVSGFGFESNEVIEKINEVLK